LSGASVWPGDRNGSGGSDHGTGDRTDEPLPGPEGGIQIPAGEIRIEDTRLMTEREELTLQISGTTTMLGLIGTPVAHSKSPAMYNHCFQKFGLDWAYLAFDVPAERAGEAVAAIRTLGMRGANVTMPCKNAVIPFLDE